MRKRGVDSPAECMEVADDLQIRETAGRAQLSADYVDVICLQRRPASSVSAPGFNKTRVAAVSAMTMSCFLVHFIHTFIELPCRRVPGLR